MPTARESAKRAASLAACAQKNAYASRREAMADQRRSSSRTKKQHFGQLRPYRCTVCRLWHLTHFTKQFFKGIRHRIERSIELQYRAYDDPHRSEYDDEVA